MSAKLNALVLLSIAALIGGCGGGGSDGDGDGNDAAGASSPTVTEPVGQASPSSAPASGKDPLEQRTN
ncbi:hypothetical protein [Variovorax arabinosiphilus]|uniref:hypothetical protein n=1 Tax=Variovorax arabinosiphilus TaxID=3053498 RepID=UPI00257867E1|nr:MULTISPECIES: hypothetical protein [unclassified Variovorax]MDM0119940.1 hypothetical protein [Variovorax sp. J2L1-78]MDM0128148.1 hypothetical protein [Variovorax sp. J2L1-63]MDM0231848.1 hypothetical protein [Variovorax sp. J2R1-6]